MIPSPSDEYGDKLSPARGCMNGCILMAIFYAVMIILLTVPVWILWVR